MAGGASSANMDDTYVAALFEARILPEIRPSMTSREFLRWGSKGKSKAFSFSLLDDITLADAATEGTDYTTVTDITTTKQTATASEVAKMTTVSDVLIEVSLLDAMATAGGILTRAVGEKWETDVAAIADNFGSTTTAASTLTPQDLLAAISAIEQRDAATGNLVAYLHPKQVGELRAEISQTTAPVTAKQSGITMGPMTSELGSPVVNTLFGVRIYSTSLVASGAGLRQGSVFVAGQALGAYELWGPRLETERRATLRGFYVISTADYGVVGVDVTNRGQMLKSAA